MLGSSNPVAIKAALLEGWPPMVLGLCRMSVIGFFFAGWAFVLREHFIGPNGAARRWALAAAACKGAGVLFFYLSLAMIPVNRAIILSTVSPVVNLWLVHLLLSQERIRRHHVAGMAITFVGMLMVILLRQGGEGLALRPTANYIAGDLAMLASVVFHQAMIVFEKRALIEGTNPRQLIISTSIVAVAVFGIFVVFGGESLTAVPTGQRALAVFIYLVTFVGVVLFFYRRWLVSVMEVSYINSFSHAGKALSIVYAVILLGEPVPALSIAGFILIIGGTAVATGRDGLTWH
jgi:drug/metabolite transporter (DMT)-like permease